MADSLDAQIIRRASQNHRIVTHVELRRLGRGQHAIYYRLRTGRLHREFPGVYAVGTPAMSAWERSTAAVTACGRGSLLADLAALALWGWLESWPHKLSVITPNDRRPKGITVHRARTLTNKDRGRRYGIPVTSPARTQLDCAVLLPAQTLTRVVNDALHTPQLSRRLLKEICRLHPKHPGAKLIRPFYDTTDGPTRSDWQDDFPTWCVKHGMPRPKLEHKIGPHTVDACFIEERLIVELDSWQSTAATTASKPTASATPPISRSATRPCGSHGSAATTNHSARQTACAGFSSSAGSRSPRSTPTRPAHAQPPQRRAEQRAHNRARAALSSALTTAQAPR
jgi:hypothetical protein